MASHARSIQLCCSATVSNSVTSPGIREYPKNPFDIRLSRIGDFGPFENYRISGNPFRASRPIRVGPRLLSHMEAAYVFKGFSGKRMEGNGDKFAGFPRGRVACHISPAYLKLSRGDASRMSCCISIDRVADRSIDNE